MVKTEKLRIYKDNRVVGSGYDHNLDTVEIVTQLSLDRISRLEAICQVWDGPVTAAILDEDRTINGIKSGNKEKSSFKILQSLECSLCKRDGFHSLRTLLVKWTSAAEDRSYPINSLRNIALRNARSDFVFLLDVDCIPSSDLYQSLVGTIERKRSIRNICLHYLGAIVVPCFEPVDQSLFDPRCHLSSQEVRKQSLLSTPTYRQFALQEFERGHGATNYQKWLSHTESQSFQQYYQIEFQEGFEPFLVVSRALTPLYVETLVGYGRNKILHVYHMSRLGITFWVTFSGCIIHTPHPLTTDRVQLLGDPLTSEGAIGGRLENIKSIYGEYRERASVFCSTWALGDDDLPDNTEISNISNLSSPVDLLKYDLFGTPRGSYRGTSIASWPKEEYYRKLLLSHLPISLRDNNCLSCARHDTVQTHISEEFMAELCSIHLTYKVPLLTRIRNYGLSEAWNHIFISGVRSSLWLVTHLSIDRIDRLLAICRNWDGPIAAAIWIPPSYTEGEKRSSLQNLENSLFSYSHLKIVVLENTKCHSRSFSLVSPPLLSPDLYPFNALRGIALDIVKEIESTHYPESFDPKDIFVLIIDVDMRPPRILSSVFFSSEYDSSVVIEIFKACKDSHFVVLPALEFVEFHLVNSEELALERLLSTVDQKEFHRNLEHLSSNIQPFHVKQYPEGHGPSKTSYWLQSVLSGCNQLVPIDYEEGYEPYGILSLQTVIESGGFHRAFVGRHKDKIEFILRLHLLGTKFKLWSHPAAFVFDWLPHPTHTSSSENKLHRIVMEGLFRRLRRQVYRYKEIPWNSSSSSETSSIFNGNIISRSLSFRKLHEMYRSTLTHGELFWKSDEYTKVHSVQPVPSITMDDLHPGTICITQNETAKISNGIGISVPFTIHIPLRVISCLGISYLVKFPVDMDWVGGSLCGLRATGRELNLLSGLPFEKSGQLDGRIKWNEHGTARFQLTGIPPKTPGFHIVMNREIQFHKDVWHRIEVVFSLQGQMEASIDSTLIFSAKYLPTFVSLDGVRLAAFKTHNLETDIYSSSPLFLSDIVISGNSNSIVEKAPELSMECIHSLITSDITVIFGPKEWHSLATRSLHDFLTCYGTVFEIIIVIAPPIPRTMIEDMQCLVALFPQTNCKFHYAKPFQNPYEIRNLLAKEIRTKYTLHLNNDIFAVEGYSHWLVQLVQYAEKNTKYCAVMPFLLENNVHDSTRLHVWWEQCRLHSSGSLYAIFDNTKVKTPYEEIRRKWLNHGMPPLHFLEDHCILVRTDYFRYSPLFDPFSCYRREFFDLAWSIRSRGGEIGMALDSVVLYQRLQPLGLLDLPYFLHRRQDSLCFSSQIYLNKKWGISYRYDRWHEKQRSDSLRGMKYDLGENLLSLQNRHQIVELIACFLVAVGSNRFSYNQDISQRSDEGGETMDTFYPTISTIDWNCLTDSPIALLFRQEFSHRDFPVTPDYRGKLIRFLESVQDNQESQQVSPDPLFIANPFSGYILFRLQSHTDWRNHIKDYDYLRDLPSLIIQYRDLKDQVIHFEYWVWIQTSLAVPDSLPLSLNYKSSEYSMVLASLNKIGSFLNVKVIPSTPSAGTHSWQTFDLIREEKLNDGTPTLVMVHLLQYSFQPHTLQELQDICAIIESFSIN